MRYLALEQREKFVRQALLVADELEEGFAEVVLAREPEAQLERFIWALPVIASERRRPGAARAQVQLVVVA